MYNLHYFFIFYKYFSLEQKVSQLEDENHVMRQKALSASPKSNRPGFAKAFTEVCCYICVNIWDDNIADMLMYVEELLHLMVIHE